MIPLERILGSKLEAKGSFIGGRWRQVGRASGTVELISPANMEWVLPPLAYSYDVIEESVHEGRKAFNLWRATPLSERIRALKAFGAELAQRADLLARVLSLETGKPLDEALGEVSLLQSKISVTIEEALPLVASREVDLGAQGRGEIHWKPRGVLVVIGPFNFPLHLNHSYIVPALLMGNVCILKPSEKTPYSAQLYIEAAEAAGLPAGVLQLVQGPAEVGVRLVRQTQLDGVLATCSFEVGTRIEKELAERPEKLVSLEMGGKNAAIVWEGASLEKTATDIIKSAYLTSGQRCTALSRVYVKKELLAPLSQAIHALAKELVISHPFDEDPKPFMGPLISSAAKEKFLRYSNIAESEGNEVLMRSKSLEGKNRLSRKPMPMGHYVTPSIHLVPNWDPKSAYQNHEIFGPDLFLCPVESLDEGVAAVNSSSYGLVASFFGGRSDFDQVADRLECGLVYLNRPTIGASARMPFGGWKHSGNGRPAGIFAIYASSQVQSRVF